MSLLYEYFLVDGRIDTLGIMWSYVKLFSSRLGALNVLREMRGVKRKWIGM